MKLIANVTVHTEESEKIINCYVGVDSKKRLVIRSSKPIDATVLYLMHYDSLKETGEKIEKAFEKMNNTENTKKVNALISDMSGSIQAILDEIRSIPRIPVNEASKLIDPKRADEHTTKSTIYIDDEACDNLKIHWMENPEYLNLKIRGNSFKYKGTDDNKNNYLSRDLIHWYREIEGYCHEDPLGCRDILMEVENNKKMTNNISPAAKAFIDNVNKEIENNMDTINQITDEAEKDPFENMDFNVSQVESKFSVGVKDAVNAFTKWMINQDPINLTKKRPVHYKIICDLIEILYAQLLMISKSMFNDYFYIEVTEKELKDLIHKIIFDDVATKDYFTALNISFKEAKNGVTIKDRYENTEPSVTFSSRYGGPMWQDDFIDLDALWNNVVREIIKVSTPTAE